MSFQTYMLIVLSYMHFFSTQQQFIVNKTTEKTPLKSSHLVSKAAQVKYYNSKYMTLKSSD